MIKKKFFLRINYSDFKIIGVFVIILFSSLSISSQINRDTLNKFNENKLKQGYWLIYLTDRLIPTKDTLNASFYAFDYYESGIRIGFFSIADDYRKRAKKVIFVDVLPIKGKVLLLNGNVKYYDKDSISLDEIYINGIPQLRQSYVWVKNNKCKYKQIINYNHKYKSSIGSFEYTYFYNGNVINKSWFRKQNNIWSFHKEIDERSKIKDIFIYKYNIFLNEANIIYESEKNDFVCIDIGYQGNVINNQLNHCLNFNYINFFAGRYGLGFSTAIGSQYSKRNNIYSNIKDSNLVACGIAFFESNILNHYFIISKKSLKVSVFSDVGLNQFFPFNDDNGLKYLKNQNSYMDLKNGLCAFILLNKINLKTEIYYRNQLFGVTNYGNIHNFEGLGLSIGFLWKG